MKNNVVQIAFGCYEHFYISRGNSRSSMEERLAKRRKKDLPSQECVNWDFLVGSVAEVNGSGAWLSIFKQFKGVLCPLSSSEPTLVSLYDYGAEDISVVLNQYTRTIEKESEPARDNNEHANTLQNISAMWEKAQGNVQKSRSSERARLGRIASMQETLVEVPVVWYNRN